MIDLTQGKLDEELAYAEEIGDTTLKRCIEHMKNVDQNSGSTTKIMTDRAPRSFYFERFYSDENFRGNGGIIFHGPHDGGGAGVAPTFSVSMTTNLKPHWEIHT